MRVWAAEMDGHGTTTIAWAGRGARGGSDGSILVKRWRATGSIGKRRIVAKSPPEWNSVQDVSVDANRRGDTLVAFTRWTEAAGEVLAPDSALVAVYRPVGGSWAAPDQVTTTPGTDDPGDEFGPAVTLAQSGDAAAVWQHARIRDSGAYPIKHSRYNAPGR
jgi:hypothetical protein